MRGIFEALGQAITAALHRTEALITRLADALPNQGGQPEVITAHLEGQRVGRIVHGVSLGIPAVISQDEARTMRNDAEAHAEDAITLASSTLTEDRIITREFLTAYAAAIIIASVWTGQDTAGRNVATQAGARWKEWVRTDPRKEHRQHHDALEGHIVPIDAFFEVSGRLVTGPRDWDRLSDAGEWMNCGHGLRYHYRASRGDL